MVALTQDRKTPSRSADLREPPVKAGAILFAGAMVAIDATGFAVRAATATTLKVIGPAQQRVDNSTGADGDRRVPTSAGCHRFENSASGDLITRSDIGALAYAVDDQTVAKTNGSNTRSVAGTIFDVDELGVWILFS